MTFTASLFPVPTQLKLTIVAVGGSPVDILVAMAGDDNCQNG